jgi:hypothetical protein
VQRLSVIGATFFQTTVRNDQVLIPSSQWLTKVCISHAECEGLLKHIDLESLKRYGDIVLRMPRDMPKFDMSTGPALCGELVFVGFFDIGIRSVETTRRMHLRAPPEQRAAWADGPTATRALGHVQSVLSRRLSHVRVLDVHRKGCDRQAASLSESYDLCLWIGSHDQRMSYLKQKNAKSVTVTAASSAGRNAWQNRSSGSRRPSESWQAQPWSSDDRSVRSRSSYRNRTL